MKKKRLLLAILSVILVAVTQPLFSRTAKVSAGDYREIAVAVGATVTFNPSDIVLRGFDFDKKTVVTDDVTGAISYVMSESKQGTRKVDITGKRVGTSVAVITYLDSNGKEKKQTLLIRVTDPEVSTFDTYMVRGRTYAPILSQTASCSSIYLAAQDTSVVQTGTDEDNGSVFVPVGLGVVKIAVVVDGRQYVQSVKAINPVLNKDSLIIEKKEKASLEVDGIPPSMKVTFASSKPKIAKVSKEGVITAKKKGECVITASVHVSETDVITLECIITVGKKKSVLAVMAAEKALGAEYSREKRMQACYYDCSSLVWRAYKEAGLPLDEAEYAPVAADIAKELENKWAVVATEYTDPDLLEPGDLIFYRSAETNDRYRSIGHVAMFYGSCYTDGDERVNKGRIIHANNGVELTVYSSFRKSNIVLILRCNK